MSIRELQVQRVTLVSAEPFNTVIARIDAHIGHPDMAAFRKSLSAAQNETEMEEVVDLATQPDGIMEFTRFSQEGDWSEYAKDPAHRCRKSADHEGDGQACS